MQAKKLLKQEDGPRIRIMAEAKRYAKSRKGIQAGEQDVTARDMFYAQCNYFEQLEAAILYLQSKLEQSDAKTK